MRLTALHACIACHRAKQGSTRGVLKLRAMQALHAAAGYSHCNFVLTPTVSIMQLDEAMVLFGKDDRGELGVVGYTFTLSLPGSVSIGPVTLQAVQVSYTYTLYLMLTLLY